METFGNYLIKSKAEKNKVGFLVDAFKEIHTNAPKMDLDRLGGRMAGLYKSCQGNTELLLKIIWCSVTQNIQGSHLDYITKSANSIMKSNKKATKLEGHAGMETD